MNGAIAVNLIVNGKDVMLDDSSVSGLLAHLNIKFRVVVEKNGKIIDPDYYERENLNDGDVIEIVQFVGGG